MGALRQNILVYNTCLTDVTEFKTNMVSCKVALIILAVLLQCKLQHAANCENRKTVIQVRIPGKMNIDIKYPDKSKNVIFNPSPYPNKNGVYDGDCFVCNGPRCQRCTKPENQVSFPIKTQGNDPLRTNIIIDLRRKTSETQNESNNNGQFAGGISPQDGTVVVVQDSTAASSASQAATSDSSQSGGQAAASSASSATLSNTDIVASFDPNSSEGTSVDNVEDIFVKDVSQSTAGSSAVSEITSNVDTSSISAGDGGNVASSGGAATVAGTGGTSPDGGALTKLIVKTKSAVPDGDGDVDGDGDGVGTLSTISNAAAEALNGFD